jgi:pyruvate/2-oxoacid:ferredoxin oxidoreductase alpha subunit
MGWGATRHAIREAIDILNAQGVKANALHFIDIYPLDEARLEQELAKAHHLIDVEGNYTAQLAQVVRVYTGRAPDDKILKYDGRPFSGVEIAKTVAVRLNRPMKSAAGAPHNGHDGHADGNGNNAQKSAARKAHV